MAFYSIAFLSFVLFFVILHEFIGHFFPDLQWAVRLLAGISFFVYISGLKIVFLLVSAVSIWGGAITISNETKSNKEYRKQEGLSREEKKASKIKSRNKKKMYVAFVVALNLAFLLMAKYILPVTAHPIALPLGISFYTLQAISYIIDIYGEKYEPQQNPGKVMLFLCWFPQMIQGPINRYDHIEQDLYKTYRLNAPDFRLAFYVFLFGAVKKYAIADLLAPMVNASLNDNASVYPGSYLLFGAFLYAIEQYADFSGGIDMAMGASLLFGVRMAENFRQPYFSTSLSEFWRRWHISLGSWMRDYIFYPFVTTKPLSRLNGAINRRFGNHAGRAVIGGISNLLVFALVGLWHGPELHFIAWGLYNGLIIALSDAAAPLFVSINRMLHIGKDSKGLYCFRILRTFMIIVFAGYFDVIGSVRTGFTCFFNTFFNFDHIQGTKLIGQLISEEITSAEAIVTTCISIILLIINSVLKERGHSPVNYVCSRRYMCRWVVCFALMGLLLYSFTVSFGSRGFMYAAF